MPNHHVRRAFLACVAVAGVVLAAGCNRAPPQTGADDTEPGKQSWQSARAPQELDQLRNRLMHSQNDR